MHPRSEDSHAVYDQSAAKTEFLPENGMMKKGSAPAFQSQRIFLPRRSCSVDRSRPRTRIDFSFTKSMLPCGFEDQPPHRSYGTGEWGLEQRIVSKDPTSQQS
jgi:hypothetical protein